MTTFLHRLPSGLLRYEVGSYLISKDCQSLRRAFADLEVYSNQEEDHIKLAARLTNLLRQQAALVQSFREYKCTRKRIRFKPHSDWDGSVYRNVLLLGKPEPRFTNLFPQRFRTKLSYCLHEKDSLLGYELYYPPVITPCPETTLSSGEILSPEDLSTIQRWYDRLMTWLLDATDVVGNKDNKLLLKEIKRIQRCHEKVNYLLN